MIEETRKNLKVNRDVSLSEVADLSLLREAQREKNKLEFQAAKPNKEVSNE
jgi:hypothetical protein